MGFKTLDAHTTGPWKVGDRNTDDNTLAIIGCDGIREGKYSRIASVKPRPFYADDQEANARLLAAAPDLLAACEAARRVIVHSRQRGACLTQPWANLLDSLHAAIAKATQK